MMTRGFDPPPPPPLPPPDPPPAAAPSPRTLAIVTPVIPNAGTASAAVSDGDSMGKYLLFSTGIETEIGESP